MILTIFKKDLKLFFSDKKGAMLTFALPILLISLFAFAFGGVGGTRTANPIALLVVDNDLSIDSKNVISKLDTLKVIQMIKKEKKEATSLVKKGKYVAVLIFEKGFQDSILLGKKLPMELIYDASREMEIGMLQSVLMQNLMSSIGEKIIREKMETSFEVNFPGTPKKVKEKIMQMMSPEKGGANSLTGDNMMGLKMTSIIKEESKRGNLGLIQAVAGTAIMMLLFSIAGIGGGLLDEKDAGTLKRLLYAPLKPIEILFGKMIAALVVSILQLTIMFLFSWIAFGLPIFRDIPSLILMILATAFAVSSFGMFLVSIAKTRQQLQGYSTIIIMLMSA
ncbi:MAG: ABC transporter permease, partial [Flavobacteriaceae bacterium]|nr:ABC transporter permease [Flavobacteriaceae bacterium]